MFAPATLRRSGTVMQNPEAGEMKILVLGAGAVGGYYGARLLQAGANATFLVRDARARQLAEKGLVIARADETFRMPAPGITRVESGEHFDVILLSCKAYDLPSAVDSVAAAVGPDTVVVPLLNGIAHLDGLERRFGRARVAGGSCHLAAALEADGTIRLHAPLHRIVYGAREGNAPQAEEKLRSLHGYFSRTPVPAVLSTNVMQELWDKYVLLCTLAAMTCLMRSSVGDIVSTDLGRGYTLQVLETCVKVATQAGYAPSKAVVQGAADWATLPGSTFTASMLRDIERGGPTEGEHILGEMVRRAEAAGIEAQLLAVAHCHLQAYEARRRREPGSA
jgi:2-dehydropantoate 2-reductase